MNWQIFPQKSQTEQPPQFDSANICHVYTAQIPANLQIEPLPCQLRNQQIAEATHPLVKAEKYYVWKLLQYALHKTFGFNAQDMHFDCNNGKWTTPSCHFSLSHSNGVVACAVSNAQVGVDIELVSSTRRDVVARVLTWEEKDSVTNLSGKQLDVALLTIWSQKESIFKSVGGNNFVPSKVQTVGANVASKIIDVGNNQFVLSTSTPLVEQICYFIDIQL